MNEEKLNSLTREEAIDYLDNQMNYTYQLRQENDFLKADNIHIRKIRDNLLNENHKLETVLDEIRKYIDEFIIYVDEDGEVYFKEEFRTEYNDLLQILDKVKE